MIAETSTEIKKEIKPIGVYPGIHFEPGIHPAGRNAQEESDRIYARFQDGDPRAHIWNTKLLTRISRYQPRLLTIDSLVPAIGDLNRFGQQDNPEEKLLWLLLPGKPSEINNSGELFVIKGDFGYFGDFLASFPNSDMQGALNKRHNQENIASSLKMRGEFFVPSAIYTLYFCLKQAKDMRGQPLTLEDMKKSLFQPITRRQFLKNSGIIGTALILAASGYGRLSIPYNMGESINESDKELMLKLVEAARPRIFKLDQVDFRTAILIEKTQDAIDQLKLERPTPASIILGASHGYEARSLMESYENRRETIKSYTRHLMDILDLVSKDFPNVDKDKARRSLLDHISAFDVASITDPGDPPYSPSLPDVVARNVKPLGSFSSQRVRSALDSFY